MRALVVIATSWLVLSLEAGCSSAAAERCPSGEVLCDDACVPAGVVCCGYGNGAICPAGHTCGTSAAQPCVAAGGAKCSAGQCANIFASGKAFCCPGDMKYYCDGTNLCYATWEDAYYGQSCVLPADRVCF